MQPDVHSLGAMPLQAEEAIDLLVIGGGEAGLRTAIDARKAGRNVVLVDENPIPASTMGLDVPLVFGQRMTAAVQNRNRMIEQIVAASSFIEEAFELGVDIRLGIAAWGLFPPSKESRGAAEIRVGLEDGERAWVVGCTHVVLATGSRDVMFGFKGWDQPGVAGAAGLTTLVEKYNACASREILILGSGDTAVALARSLVKAGRRVAGLVEVMPDLACNKADRDWLTGTDIPIFINCSIVEAGGGADGVTHAVLRELATEVEQADVTVACDTICVAINRVPSVELFSAAGGALRFHPALQAWVPDMIGSRSSLAGIQLVGSCSGRSDDLHIQVRDAVARILEDTDTAVTGVPQQPKEPATDVGPGLIARWIETQPAESLGVDVCLCEEVSRHDLIGLRPPAYVDRTDGKSRTLEALMSDGPLNPDQVKRLTRCGMGECQGRRCREQTTYFLARQSGQDLAEVRPATFRAPVRPIPLAVLAAQNEPASLTEGWDSWFGIPSQFQPFWLEDNEGEQRRGQGWHL